MLQSILNFAKNLNAESKLDINESNIMEISAKIYDELGLPGEARLRSVIRMHRYNYWSKVLLSEFDLFMRYNFDLLDCIITKLKGESPLIKGFIEHRSFKDNLAKFIRQDNVDSWLSYAVENSQSYLISYLTEPGRFVFSDTIFEALNPFVTLATTDLLKLSACGAFDELVTLSKTPNGTINDLEQLNFTQGFFTYAFVQLSKLSSEPIEKVADSEIELYKRILLDLVQTKPAILKKKFAYRSPAHSYPQLQSREMTLTKIYFSMNIRVLNAQLDNSRRSHRTESSLRFLFNLLTELNEDIRDFTQLQNIYPPVYQGSVKWQDKNYWLSKQFYTDYFNFLSPLEWLSWLIRIPSTEILINNIKAWDQDELISIMSHELIADTDFESQHTIDLYKNIACACLKVNSQRCALRIIHDDPTPWRPAYSGPFKGVTYEQLAQACDQRNTSFLHMFWLGHSHDLKLMPIVANIIKVKKRHAQSASIPSSKSPDILNLSVLAISQNNTCAHPKLD